MKRKNETPKKLSVELVELNTEEAEWVAGGAKGSGGGGEGCCDNRCNTWCGPGLPPDGIPF